MGKTKSLNQEAKQQEQEEREKNKIKHLLKHSPFAWPNKELLTNQVVSRPNPSFGCDLFPDTQPSTLA